jgi:putative flavoprotein involved in K+ transport
MEYIETVIIGGGQAGLATGYQLKKVSKEYLILEKTEKAVSNWRNRCWDSFTLVTPNSAFRIPGIELTGKPNDAFMPRDEVIKTFDKFMMDNQLPVKFNTEVYSVEKTDTGYIVQTTYDVYKTKNVVVATGLFHKPRIPSSALKASDGILQIHSSKYRNPHLVPDGAVLVVGSAQSGCQIAEELNEAGRKVFLTVGTAGRVPRRYRGKDIIEWFEATGMFDQTPEQLPPGVGRFRGIPHLSGKNGGHTINLHSFAKDGITLLGHLKGLEGHKAKIAPDLHNSLTMVDGFELHACNAIDDYINRNSLNAPPEERVEWKDGYNQNIIEDLDLEKENIKTIIWACGYTFDYSFIKLPIFDDENFPVQRKGVTDYQGLYFVGMPWMPSPKSGILLGVGEAAKYIASRITDVKESYNYAQR